MKTLKINKSVITIFNIVLFFFTFTSKAQSIEVKGIILGQTYEKTEALNGANIFLKGTKTGTSSNKKGEFTFPIKLKVGDVLEISYLGFTKKNINIKNNSSFLKITLTEDENQMLGALNSNKPFKSKRSKQ